eukprot:409545_1
MTGAWNWWSITSLVLFFIVMLGLGASLKLSEFLLKLKKPTGIIIGAILQFLLMPFICFMLTRIFSIEGNLSVGVLLIGVCPGGALSNIVCYIFMEDITLSIAMTTFSSLLALLFVPLNLYIYLETLYTSIDNLKYDIGGLAISITVVILGTICGLYLSTYKNGIYSYTLERIARCSMLLLIIGSFIANSTSNTPLWEYESLLYFIILLPTIIGSFSGIICSKILCLKSSSCVAVGVETGMQNQILAIAIITLTFDEIEIRNQILGIPLVYGTFSTLYNALLCLILFSFFSITDAPNGVSILKAWKLYQKQRKLDIEISRKRLLLIGNKSMFYNGVDTPNDSFKTDDNSPHDIIALSTGTTPHVHSEAITHSFSIEDAMNMKKVSINSNEAY